MVCVPLASVTVAVATLVPDAKPAAAFLASSGEMEASILASLSLPTSAIHPRAVGAQRARLEDLPLVLAVLAELHGLAFGGEIDARQLVGIEGEQALVAQIVEALIEAGLDEAEDGVDVRVVRQLGVGAGAVGGIVADQELVRSCRLSCVTVTSSVGCVRPYGARSVALSSMVLSAVTEVRAETSDWRHPDRPPALSGCTSRHLPLARLSSTTSPLAFWILIS